MTETQTERTLSWMPPNASPLGLAVARVFDDIWALYNVRFTKKTDFSDAERIEVNFDRTLATFDFDHLTQLVVRCHDACVRLSIGPCNMRYLTLHFSKRDGRVGKVWDRHPTIESAIQRIRRFNYFTRDSVTPQESVVDAKDAEVARLKAWVADLQAGMTVNCFYCGLSYGPRGSTPVSMADILTTHIEACADHPMSALKAEVARLTAENHELREMAANAKWSLEV